MLGNQVPFNARITFILLNISLTIVLLYYGKSLFVPLFFGVLFSLMLLPLSRKFEKKLHLPRIIAAFVSVSIVVVGVSLLVMLLMKQFLSFADKIPLFVTRINDLLTQVQAFCQDHTGIKVFTDKGTETGLAALLSSGESFIADTLVVTTGLMINVGLVIVYTFFFLLYRDSFSQFVFHLFPSQEELIMSQLIRRIQKLVQSYILGILSVICTIAILNSIGLSLLKIENAIFLGVFAACFAVIPYIGVFVGAIIPLAVAFITKDSPWYAVGVAGLSVIVHLLEGNIITPYFVGRRVRINPLTVVIGMLVGELIWGLSGIVLSIPIIAVIKSVFDTVDKLKPYGFMLGLEMSRDKPDFSIFTARLKIGKEKEVSS